MNRSLRRAALLTLFATFLVPRGARAESTPENVEAGPAQGESPDSGSFHPSVSFGATYASRYLFQGIDYSEGSPVVQPEAAASWRGLSVGLWGNVDPSRREWNELDVAARVGWETGTLAGGLGISWLDYPNRPADWTDSREIVGDIAWTGIARASLNVHVDLGGGGYAAAGIERSFRIGTLEATVGPRLYAQSRYDGHTGLSALETRAALNGSWGRIAWSPSVSRCWTWTNGDFRGADALPSVWLLALTLSGE